MLNEFIQFIQKLYKVKRWDLFVLKNKICHSVVYHLHYKPLMGLLQNKTCGHLLDNCNQCHSEHVRDLSNVFIWFLICVIKQWPYQFNYIVRLSLQCSWSDTNVISYMFGSSSFITYRWHNLVHTVHAALWEGKMCFEDKHKSMCARIPFKRSVL